MVIVTGKDWIINIIFDFLIKEKLKQKIIQLSIIRIEL